MEQAKRFLATEPIYFHEKLEKHRLQRSIN